MTENWAWIVVTEHQIPFDYGTHRTYEWEGKKTWKTRLSIDYLIDDGFLTSIGEGFEIWIGPYPLKIIEIRDYSRDVVCVRTDVLFGLIAIWYSIWQFFHPHVMKIWWRILATWKIWGILPDDSKLGR